MVSELSAALRDPRLAAPVADGRDDIESPSRGTDHDTAERDDGTGGLLPATFSVPDSYHVLAFRARDANPAAPAPRLDRLLAELRQHCGTGILPVLDADGGTVLVPESGITAADLDALLTAAATAAGVHLVTAVVRAELGSVPTAYRHAHELLELATALGRDAGVYRFHDLALEYQLTRPGRARDTLSAIIAPLRPELRATLTRYLRYNGDEAATARAMNLPRVAVATRLADIARLTGLEPRRPTDLWRLRAALVAGTVVGEPGCAVVSPGPQRRGGQPVS